MNTLVAKSAAGEEIPRIIHFSVPPVMSADEEKCIATARRLYPDWEIKVWKDPLDPAGFRLARLWKLATSGAQLSDLIRLEVVHRYGGFYFDNDFDFHKSLEPLRAHSFVICSEDGQVLTNAFFGAEKSSPILELLISQLEKLTSLPAGSQTVEATGPRFFARFLRWNNGITVVPRELFYPYNWDEQPVPHSPVGVATHLWSGSWVAGGNKKEDYKKRARRFFTAKVKPALKRTIRKLRHLWGGDGTYAMTDELMIATAHGHSIIASGRDLSITPHLARDGYYERNDELFIASIVKGGDWCLDVGANIGVFSLLFAAKVGPFGRVFAFEPNPFTRKYLERSAVLNWVHDRLKISSAAVGQASGTATLHFSPEILGGALIGASTEMQQKSHGFANLAMESAEVELMALDEAFPDWAFFTCVKIDVEGKETDVLRGARRLFSEGRIACLLIECLQELGQAYFEELTAELRRLNTLGYICGYSDNSGKFKARSLDQLIQSAPQRNWIFIHSAYLDRLIS